MDEAKRTVDRIPQNFLAPGGGARAAKAKRPRWVGHRTLAVSRGNARDSRRRPFNLARITRDPKPDEPFPLNQRTVGALGPDIFGYGASFLTSAFHSAMSSTGRGAVGLTCTEV